MKIRKLIFLLLLISCEAHTQSNSKIQNKSISINDTLRVNELNKSAFQNRLKNPELTLRQANSALKLAIELKFLNGIGEAYRVIGVGKSYQNQIDGSIKNYLIALSYFKESNNSEGVAKVYNNIGNLYRDIDYDKSLENFDKSLKIARKLEIKDLIAGLYLNIGTVNQRKKKYDIALNYYKQSLLMFQQLNNSIGVLQSQQNLGLIYLNLNELEKAEKYLIDAREKAYKNSLNNSIANLNLTLSSVYITQKKFKLAEASIKEGLKFARITKDSKLEYNYILTSYDLENVRKNHQRALYYLQQVYRLDSISYKNNVSEKIHLLEAQHQQLEKQRENELTIAKQKYTQILFWAISIVALLAFIVIFLLIKNVRKSVRSNKELTRLNLEVSNQKDDLDRVNHNLEEIIEVRTKDLKIKNTKLSEYSSHLSHQIRSPVATLKGLILLEKDNLIEQEEFVEQMGKCIYDLDDKIININENLNDPLKSGLINED